MAFVAGPVTRVTRVGLDARVEPAGQERSAAQEGWVDPADFGPLVPAKVLAGREPAVRCGAGFFQVPSGPDL